MRFRQRITKAISIGLAMSLSSGGLTAYADEQTSISTNDTITTNVGVEEPINIIYITLDDIGFSDLGAYGSEIQTPNIDALAENGLTYTNFNANPMSSATRASLLTGRENNSVGVGQVTNVSKEEDLPGLQGRITDEAGLISEILKQEADYNCYAVGKWHVAPAYTLSAAGPYDYWPLGKGFDRFYGFMDGETDQYNPQLVEGNEVLENPYYEGYNLNDDLLEHAEQYIIDHESVYPDKGFFLNYAFGTGHSPQQVSEEYIDMYDGVYDVGYDVIREQRFEKQKELGIIPEDAVLGEYDSEVPHWDTLTEDEKALSERFMQCYAGYITQADDEVGKLVDVLKRTGIYDNTVIVLIGDNGATELGGPYGTDSFVGGMSGGRFPTADELISKIDEIGGDSMQALYPRGWAQVSNTPFEHYKGSVYAGALRNPLIISWPDGISDVGTIRDQYVSVADITPTMLDIVGVEAPEYINGVEQMPMYGVSFASTFESPDAPETRTTDITYIQGLRTVYNDGWKAVSVHETGTSFDDDTWELYDLNNDYSETTDVADQYPEKVEEMKALFEQEAQGKNIYPLTESNTQDMGFVRHDSPANRTSFTYYNGTNIVGVSAAPQINVNNFNISTTINRDSVEDEGVIVAMGDEMGGYSFYIKDNKLIFLYNRYGEIFKVESDIDVPTGEVEIAVQGDKDTFTSGTLTLYINGEEVGNGPFETAPLVTLEGMDIGRDTRNPVSEDYADLGDFNFTGDLDSVQFELSPFVPTGVAH